VPVPEKTRDDAQLQAVSSGLGPGNRRILRSVCEAFLPDGGSFSTGAEEIALAQKVEAYFAGALPRGTALLALLLRWIELQPLLFHLRLRRFPSLSLEDRVRVLEGMEASRLLLRCQPIRMLKLLLGLHAYRTPEVAIQVGRDPSHLQEAIRAAAERRSRGDKGPYPTPEAPMAMGGR
jgi:hypothetical protein